MRDIFEAMLSGRFGGTIVIAVLFAAIVALLRFLYGPGGKFRDPRWDEGNRQIRVRQSEERERRLQKAADDTEVHDDGK